MTARHLLGQAVVVVRVRNGSGQEVQKLSQRYQLSGDARDVEAARQGDIIFYRESISNRASTRSSRWCSTPVRSSGSARVTTLNVPAAGGDAAMSSLVLVNRIEETCGRAADRRGGGAALRRRTLLYPNLGEP